MRTAVRRLGPVLAALAAAIMLLAPPPAAAAGRYDPRLRFRALRTAHFTIYYHQGGSAMARRLAVVAEQVRTDLAARTGLRAPGHTHVVLVDQSDVANGWSTPVPYNLIEVAATAPPPSSFLGHHDDWLRIVFAHEFAHILHLDQVGGVMKGLRWTLGRSPASFPNLFVPQWQVEGFATWAESAVTGLGRAGARLTVPAAGWWHGRPATRRTSRAGSSTSASRRASHRRRSGTSPGTRREGFRFWAGPPTERS